MPDFRKILALALAVAGSTALAEGVLVLQTDFGTRDGAVAAMKGVAVGVSPRLVIHDLSHENTPFDIWEAAYRLRQAAPYWPAGTVFVSVVDPGVGTRRKPVVVRTRSGHLFVGPDNGTWTLIAEDLGVTAVREIDVTRHHRAGSEKSHTFHGRDVFSLVGAELASGRIAFADVGPELAADVVRLAYARPQLEGKVLIGSIPVLDPQFGNVWTNLDEAWFQKLEPREGDRFRVTVSKAEQAVYAGEMPYVRTFGDVPKGAPLLYLNSLMHVAIALNMDSFVRKHGVGSGAEWSVRVEKLTP